MDDHDDTTTTDAGRESEAPSLRQRLHAATGDRDAEAAELERQSSDDTDLDDAKIAVRRAHGEAGVDRPMAEESHPDEALAQPSDVEEVHQERTS